MRSSKSRSRSKNNRNRNSLGNVVNRVFDSSGPEGKVRGTPQQIIDKYNQLARDAGLANDRVAMENFQQHAEHYLRMLAEAQREQDQRREQQERENRERQAQRDKERAERAAAEAETQPSGASDDALSVAGGEDTSGPVETPETGKQLSEAPDEANAEPKRKPRRPRRPASDDTAKEPAQDAPKDAEAPKPAPRRRAPRKADTANQAAEGGPAENSSASSDAAE